MWSEGWRPDEAGDVAAEEAAMLKEVKLSGRTILILIIYLMQYATCDRSFASQSSCSAERLLT